MRQQGITELAELVELVAAEVISEAEATRRATATDGAWDDDRVLDTVETVHWWLRRGDLRSACVLASLLMTAVERAQPELRQQAALSFVRAATEVVAIDLNGALYRQASDVAERLLPNADPERTIEVFTVLLQDSIRVLGAGHPHTMLARYRLGLSARDAGQFDLAAEQLGAVLDQWTDRFGPNSSRAISIREIMTELTPPE